MKLETFGKGAFGVVYKVYDKSNRKYYAVKELKRDTFDTNQAFERAGCLELYNLNQLKSIKIANSIKFFGAKFNQNQGSLQLIMEAGRSNLA
mmetsp:Transcript_5736/g.4917  ORF Transcript_5736/g.4917 Transcript_5736/m.4917 type:complete len:92 (+) Transcript_5736:516-791(+)